MTKSITKDSETVIYVNHLIISYMKIYKPFQLSCASSVFQESFVGPFVAAGTHLAFSADFICPFLECLRFRIITGTAGCSSIAANLDFVSVICSLHLLSV